MKQIIVDNQVTPYYIDRDGKCYNSKTNNWLKGQFSNSGYRNYNLSITPTNKKRLYAHRLVAQYYLNDGKPIPIGMEVNHKDFNKDNNNYQNLEIITKQENMQHMTENNKASKRTIYQFDKNLNLIKKYYRAKDTGYNISTIVQEARLEKKKLTYGYYWSYNPIINKQDIIEFKNLGVAKIVCQYDLNENFIKEFPSTAQAARECFPELKRASEHIGECCRGRIKTYKQYIWKYKDDIV